MDNYDMSNEHDQHHPRYLSLTFNSSIVFCSLEFVAVTSCIVACNRLTVLANGWWWCVWPTSSSSSSSPLRCAWKTPLAAELDVAMLDVSSPSLVLYEKIVFRDIKYHFAWIQDVFYTLFGWEDTKTGIQDSYKTVLIYEQVKKTFLKRFKNIW